MVIKRYVVGESARGSNQHPKSTSSSGVNSDLGEWFRSEYVEIDLNAATHGCSHLNRID